MFDLFDPDNQRVLNDYIHTEVSYNFYLFSSSKKRKYVLLPFHPH